MEIATRVMVTPRSGGGQDEVKLFVPVTGG
jgi:hypothetical protein